MFSMTIIRPVDTIQHLIQHVEQCVLDAKCCTKYNFSLLRATCGTTTINDTRETLQECNQRFRPCGLFGTTKLSYGST